MLFIWIVCWGSIADYKVLGLRLGWCRYNAINNFFFFPLCIIYSEFDGVLLDYSRQRATNETVDKLFKLAEVCLFDI